MKSANHAKRTRSLRHRARGARTSSGEPGPIRAARRRHAQGGATRGDDRPGSRDALSAVRPERPQALDRCRSSLFKDSYLKRSLARIVLWGRPSPVPGARLKDTTLTQFGAEVLSGLYLPMFMFNGRYQVAYDTTEGRYRARVEGVFRNNLLPGQYPYPFWHDAKKWSDYQRADGITLWIDPYTSKIVVGQFSRQGGADPRLSTAPRTPRSSTENGCGSTTRGSRSPSRRCSSGCSARTTRTWISCKHGGLEPGSQDGTFAPLHLTTFSLELIDLRANRRVAAPLLLVLPVEPTGGVPVLRATRRLRARSARGGRGRGGADPAQSSLRRG